MTETNLMKDRINKQTIRHIADAFSKAMPDFNTASFEKACQAGLQDLELKQRIHHIIHVLHRHLPEDFAKTAHILKRVKKHWPRDKDNQPLRGFVAWPVIDYVGVHGLDHPHLALPVLKELTSLFSAEFALRPFLLQHFDITAAYLQEWCTDKDEHVRRLVSEGSRPRLPWGIRLQLFCDNPEPILTLLEQLNADKSLYVRKSVANSLNDIGKDNPDVLIKTCAAWQNHASDETRWIIRHALRSLIKAGHPGAMHLLGYTPSPKVAIHELTLDNNKLHLGDNLLFSFFLESSAGKAQQLVVDYAIHHIKANGTTSAKVFKLKSLCLQPGSTIEIRKKHPFKKITTRRYYPGTHKLDILVNGISVNTTDFALSV